MSEKAFKIAMMIMFVAAVALIAPIFIVVIIDLWANVFARF